MKLYLVRHGETIENASRTIQGQQPGTLSPLGLKQRDRLAERLKSSSFDVVYCSDLKRTKDTLEPLTEHLSAPIYYVEEIRERSFGDLEGRSGQAYLDELKRTGLSGVDYRPPNGENFFDLRDRTDKFLTKLKEEHFEKSLLLMSHGGAIRAMLSSLLNKTLDELLRIDIQNTSLSTVEVAEDGELVRVGDA